MSRECPSGHDSAYGEHESLKAGLSGENWAMTLAKDEVTVTGGESHRFNLSVDNQVVRWGLTMCAITETKPGESGEIRFSGSVEYFLLLGNPEVILHSKILDSPMEASRHLRAEPRVQHTRESFS